MLALTVVGGAGSTVRGQVAASAQSLDQILKALSAYDGGIESGPAWKLREYVYARKDDAAGRAECEKKLLQFLTSPATPVAKMTAARHLRVIAGDSAVPALQALLADERVADLAIYALQQIPGDVSAGALAQAVKTATGTTRVAAVTALGERRAIAAVPVIAPLLQQPAFAVAAAIALGRIGNDEAASALLSAAAAPIALGAARGRVASGTDGLKHVMASSLLACAETALAANNRAAARRLYETVASDPSLPASLRKAALIGRINAAEKGADALVLTIVGGADPDMREAAISKIGDVVGPAAIGPVCALLPGLSDSAKVQLLAVLSAYPGERVAPAVMKELASPTPGVRIAALRALGIVGDRTAVRPLAEAASRASGPEQTAARAALGALKGRAVDEEVVAQLAQNAPDAVVGELLLAVGDRRIFAAKTVVASALASSSARIRINALRALGGIGTPSDIGTVLDLLIATADEPERADAETTVVALTRKIGNPDGRSRTVRDRLTAEKRAAARVRLIGALPLIADSSSLPVVRALLKDEEADVFDAAVRALAAWPTPAAREDLLQLARDSRNQTHRLLAIGGAVRLIGLDKYREPAVAVADLKQAAGFSWRPEEQKLVLGALVQFPCREALDLARGFLREPAVKAEAQAAINRITARLPKSFESRVR